METAQAQSAKVVDIMTKKVVMISQETTLSEAAAKLT